MTSRIGIAVVLLLMATVGSWMQEAVAVPYASQVRDTGGGMWEFVLNQPADNVTILRDGGNPVNLASPIAGRHPFDMTGFSDFSIQVANDTPSEWTLTSNPENLHTYFFRPTGVAVNSDPSSPYFGTVYVSNPAERVPNGLTILDPRAQGAGIYSLSANLVSVDLANDFAEQVDPDDVNLATTPPGWTVTGNAGSSPWRISFDDSNNLIVADFSDQNGGIKYASPDLQTGGLVLANEDGVLPLLINGDGAEVHGSIMSNVGVSGSVGTDLTVWAIDEDYDLDGDTFNVEPGDLVAQTSTFHPLRWDVGAATDYDQPPSIVINKEQLTVNDDNGTPEDPSDDFNDFAYTLSPQEIGGIVINNMYYDPSRSDKFYLMQSRTHGNESGLMIVTADGVDGESPTLEWASKRFSFDNGLDGNDSTFITDEETGEMAFGEGIQDIFRQIDDMVISEDGSTMFLLRMRQFGAEDTIEDGNNPVLGLGSNAPGAILVIPLDENGLPDLVIDDAGTPGDTSDDFVSNIQSLPFESPGRTFRHQLSLDAAGNVYSIDNLTESLQVFSPGGNTLAITGSDGTFSVTDPSMTVGVTGDYNDDGVVNLADYTIWRDNLGGDSSVLDNNEITGTITNDHYTQWKSNFGATAGAASVANAQVPEPQAILLLAAGIGISIYWRRFN